MTHKERRVREKEQMRQRLLDAGLELVSKKGVSALTIRSLAEHISYSTSIVYEYFESKEEIYKELNILVTKRLLFALQSVPKPETPDEYLIELVKVNIGFFEHNHHLIELLSLECFGKDAADKPVEFTEIRALFGKALKNCDCKRLKTVEDYERALNVIRSLRVGMLILSQYETSHEGLKRIANSLEDGITDLLRGWRH